MTTQSSKGKNCPLPDNDMAESTLPSNFDSPVYDMAEAAPRNNQGSDHHYEMDNMYSVLDHGTPRNATAQDYETVDQRGSQTTTQEAKNTPKHCRIEYKVLACIFITIAVVELSFCSFASLFCLLKSLNWSKQVPLSSYCLLSKHQMLLASCFNCIWLTKGFQV